MDSKIIMFHNISEICLFIHIAQIPIGNIGSTMQIREHNFACSMDF